MISQQKIRLSNLWLFFRGPVQYVFFTYDLPCKKMNSFFKKLLPTFNNAVFIELHVKRCTVFTIALKISVDKTFRQLSCEYSIGNGKVKWRKKACKLKSPYSFWKLQVLRVPMSDLFNFLCLLIHWNIHFVSSAIHQLMKTEKKHNKTKQKQRVNKPRQLQMIIKNRKKGGKRVCYSSDPSVR